jgi:2-methylcitrate dehydratase PrpD
MNEPVPTHVTATHDRLTLKLLERTQRIDAAELPSDVREIARQCVLDWVGVALGGSGDHLTRILLQEAVSEGGKPEAAVVGHAARVTASQAALVNGASSHVLDYDDVNLALNGHPSAAILPALLALAESRHAGGTELVEAFVAGYEIACRVGLLVAPGHYARGYHATCTVGALGAAAACARLLGLDAERAAHAIGIAATQAGGLKAMFGTECKPFHAGLAAHNGLRAARLAAAGMISRADALECRQGFAATLSPDFNAQAALGDAARFYIRANLFKYHASCYGTHGAIECIRHLRDANAIEPQEIARVKLRVEKGADAVCNIPNPRTALEAKFSLRFMGAAALAGADTSDLAFFEDATTADAALCALRDKVSVDLVSDWPAMQAEVVIEMKDGRVLRATHDAGVPGTDVALQGRRLVAKFGRLVEPVLGRAGCGKLLRLLERLEQTPVADLMAACAKGSA